MKGTKAKATASKTGSSAASKNAAASSSSSSGQRNPATASKISFLSPFFSSHLLRESHVQEAKVHFSVDKNSKEAFLKKL